MYFHTSLGYDGWEGGLDQISEDSTTITETLIQESEYQGDNRLSVFYRYTHPTRLVLPADMAM